MTTKIKLPKIGMRIIKTTIAVGICFAIFYILKSNTPPLIACIGAIICMQQQMEDSKEISFIRIFGTATGAFFGMLTIILFEYTPNISTEQMYIFITAMLILVFYGSLLLNQATTGGLSAIVFLCVALVDSNSTSPIIEAFNRTIETFVGAGVSLAVNQIQLPKRKEKDFLFIAKFDQILFKPEIGMTPYCRFELNTLLKKGIPLTVVTGQSPAFLQENMDGINLNLPVITMDGAVLYDMATKKHIICKEIYVDMTKKIIQKLENMNINCFVHTVFQDVLFIYHQDFKNPEELRVFNNSKNSPHRHYVHGKPYFMGKIVCISMIINYYTSTVIEEELKNIDKNNELIFIRDTFEIKRNYCRLKIYDKSVNKSDMIRHLLERTNQTSTIVFGGNHNDIEMMLSADYSYSTEESFSDVQNVADSIIKGDPNTLGDKVLHEISKIYRPVKCFPTHPTIKALKNNKRGESNEQ